MEGRGKSISICKESGGIIPSVNQSIKIFNQSSIKVFTSTITSTNLQSSSLHSSSTDSLRDNRHFCSFFVLFSRCSFYLYWIVVTASTYRRTFLL
jgi:hypothetical protein